MIAIVAVVMFLAGVAAGLLLSGVYPRRDEIFKEYLRREYGTGKRSKD